MKNIRKEVIYVGKAKHLKNRVSQYFASYGEQYQRISSMVSQINNFDYILTQSEFEALVLECNLIKIYLPKYNILLKDDKGFNYIKVTNEKWPKIVFSRDKTEDGSEYIGPYMSGMQAKEMLDMAKKVYKIPRCNRNFSEKITRPCLYYFINNCSAPCAKKIKIAEYNENVKNCVEFIKNGSKETINNLKLLMEDACNRLDFEEAAKCRDKINSIKKISLNQNIVSIENSEHDFFSFSTDKNKIAVVVFCFRNKNLFDVSKKIVDFYDNLTKVRTEFIKNYYNFSNFIPENITIDGKIENPNLIVRWLSEKSQKNVKISQPKMDFEKKIIKLCKKNAGNLLFESKKTKDVTSKNDAVTQLSEILKLENYPEIIEAYDISNISGSNNVGGMITLRNGQFSKSEYKKFKIKSISVQDDYSALSEVLERRFKNPEEKFSRLPNLILVDGGKGHVNAAKSTLSSLGINIPIFGMVKNSHHKTEALTTEYHKISLKNHPNLYLFIEKIQNEVHRFSISFHKHLRAKNMTKTELTDIPGIGKKRAINLLKKFGNIDKIAKATIDELIETPSMNKKCAANIIKYFE